MKGTKRTGKLAELIRRRIGINLTEDRDLGSLERFASARVNALGLRATSEYVELLAHQGSHGDELGRLINTVTNSHTFFFRDEPQFRAVRVLLEKRRDEAQRPMTIWSAGCATGEEPFSLAMVCADLGLDIRIVATDINREVLAVAQEGRFRAWSLRRCPSTYVDRFFSREGDETYRVRESIRRRVTFGQNNLVEDPCPSPPGGVQCWDWIFCRNVLFYFHRPVARAVLERFSGALALNGWLFLSTAEHLHGLLTRFCVVEVEGSFAYCHRDSSSRPDEQLGFVWQLDKERRKVDETDETDETFIAQLRPPAAPPAREKELPRSDHDIEESHDLYKAALSNAEKGDEDGAKQMLVRCVRDNSDYLLAWVTLGNLHLRSHDFDEALGAYENARRRNPLLPEIHYLQGVVYRKLGDVTRAIHAFRQTLFLDPSFWSASFMLAGVYGRAGNAARRHRSLALTLSLLESDERPPLFSSYVEGMQDVCIPPGEAEQICRRYLDESMTR